MYPRRGDPAVDRPILRKSKAYIDQQVAAGLAEYVDQRDPRKGIICREMLFFGSRPLPDSPARPDYFPAELPGLRFQQPPTSTLPSMAAIRARWDWTAQPMMA